MQNRLMLSRIWSAVFVHTKGFGSRLLTDEVVADGAFQFNGAAVSATTDLALGQAWRTSARPD